MSEREDGIARMRAVTISREYGSGGGEIAARLARRLGWQLIDHQVVHEVAQRLNVTDEEAEQHDERPETFIDRLLKSMQSVDPALIEPPQNMPALGWREFAAALRDVVEAAVQTGQVVIVGRGAQMILRDRRDALHVRIVAPMQQRIAYVASREQLQPAAAKQRIQQKDRARQQYIDTVFQVHVEDAHLYDLVLNTGVLRLDDCVDLIRDALAAKASRLDVPEEALGPAHEVRRYPEAPGDLPMPEAPASQ